MKTRNIIAFLLAVSAGLFIYSLPSQAACTASADFVARNSDGQFIPGAKVEVYEQITDANGDAAVGTRLTYGTTSSSSGKVTLKFREAAKYVVKMSVSSSSDSAAFWYYDVTFNCDAAGSFERVLSGIKLTLYDGEGNLLKNNTVKVYSQVYSSGSAIKETKDLLISSTTDSSGQMTVYIPQGSVRGQYRQVSDNYALVVSRGSQSFPIYNISIQDGYTTVVGYYISTLKVYLRDASTGGYLSEGTEVKVYKQGIDSDNDHQKGDYIGLFEIGDGGYGTFEYPAGVYVLEIKGKDGNYQYFWDTEIEEGRISEYDYDVSTSVSTDTVCSDYSNLLLYFKTMSGVPIDGIKYELYEQKTDSITGYPLAGDKVSSGSSDSSGFATKKFKPDSRIYYALKVYDKKSDVGDYWFWSALHFDCGEDRTLTKLIPSLNIILRDPSGALKKNFSFNLYQEQYDADGNPVRTSSSLVASLKTSETGSVSVFVAPDSLYDANKKGSYLISDSKGSYAISGIKVSSDKDTKFDYSFGGINIQATDAAKQAQKSRAVRIYSQKSTSNALSSLLYSGKTDGNGSLSLEYPSGNYAISLADQFGNEDVFLNNEIKPGAWNNISLVQGAASISSSFSASDKSSRKINIIALSRNSDGTFSAGKTVGSVTVSSGKPATADLAEGPYLFSYTSGSAVYGQAAVISHGKSSQINIVVSSSQLITNKTKFSLSYNGNSGSYNVPAGGYFSAKLKGYILLQVESHGEAWYIDPSSLARTYMKDGTAAFSIMQRSGVGAKNSDLAKIPVGLDSRLSGNDKDGDKLPDKLEQAIGTDASKKDSDGDGYDDYLEISSGYSPLGAGRQSLNNSFAKAQAGRILLQVESHGEAWYINPKDNRRYYLADGETAFQIMKYLGLGISNSDLAQISEAK